MRARGSVAFDVSLSSHELTAELNLASVSGDILRIDGKLDIKLADLGVGVPDSLVGVKVTDPMALTGQLTAIHVGLSRELGGGAP